MVELKIKVSGEEKSYREKRIVYDEDINLSFHDPKLVEIQKEALKEFDKISPGEIPKDLVFDFKMVWS